MSLVLYNTAARAKQPFEPFEPDHVRMYVCGPTVYQEIHVGNARPLVVFDVLYRVLKRLYPRVTYVRNITDVEDRIIDAARANGEPIEALTARTTEAFHESAAALGTLPPDVEPRATEHVPEMVALIEALIGRGFAYEAEGHVLFHVPAMEGYGRLSRRDRKAQIAGARVEVAPYKRDPADFVLWKPSSGDQPGWDSPWGRGRPGWHIECSAMSERHLGVPFDVHGGGRDLVFPHHENEVAQTCCAHGIDAMARFWVHNGYVTVGGEKMSKSVGNVVTVTDALAMAPGEAVRMWLLGGHYRQPLDFTEEALRQAKVALDRLYTALDGLQDVDADVGEAPEVMEALMDDLNTPKALAALHALATEANKAADPAERASVKGALLAGGDLLGLLGQEPRAWLQGIKDQTVVRVGAGTLELKGGAVTAVDGISVEEVERLITMRSDARKQRNFAQADKIRAELEAKGIVLEDRPEGTTWRRAS